MPDNSSSSCNPTAGMVSRRDFLKLSGMAVVALSLPGFLRKPDFPDTIYAQEVAYPRKLIGKLSELGAEPVIFQYPWDHPNATNFLMKLKDPAGGGVGTDNNVVAFNAFCTHQGGPLAGQFHTEVGVAGPCPLHWSTFDLNRYGMVISGHATLGLPQIILETESDDIYATGVRGLVFGYYDNRVNPNV